ncbi:threonine-phosphate decarboxylase [Megasphaera sp. SW808]|uniref:threonine-phosphate decarboxylase CobD n=1 Tax=Megasphaera sp. SW808 TaxID=2530045 RepID=UPI001439B80C|nr:threonine-phosphate decarboxylase CobD [Megasphaera sp. SW808]NJE33679.1 threonine-phosphate decarboxylase [Megasphaera sp. SW808]
MPERFEHGGNIYIPIDGGKWLDFSANINPLGLSDSVRAAIAAEIDTVVHYPDPQGRRLKEALSSYYAVPEAELLLGNGAAELFYVYMHCFRPKRVLIPVPSFNEYERAALAARADVIYCYMKCEDGFAMPVDELRRQAGNADCIMIGNPNNPTGTLTPASDIESLVWTARKAGTDVIVDESFLDFRSDSEQYAARSLVKQYDNLFVVQSLTKYYAVPGLRLGFAVVPEGKCRRLEMHKDVWNVNCLAQSAGIAALKDRTYQEKTQQYVRNAAMRLYEKVRAIPGLNPLPPTVNFMLTDAAGTGLTAYHIGAALRNEGILIRDCANYPGLTPFYFRLAVRTEEENEMLCKALKHVVSIES